MDSTNTLKNTTLRSLRISLSLAGLVVGCVAFGATPSSDDSPEPPVAVTVDTPAPPPVAQARPTGLFGLCRKDAAPHVEAPPSSPASDATLGDAPGAISCEANRGTE